LVIDKLSYEIGEIGLINFDSNIVGENFVHCKRG
jgi:hypothetical protein